MRGGGLGALAAVLGLAAAAVPAQEAAPGGTGAERALDRGQADAAMVRSAILTVETERLFEQSAFGRRVLAEIEAEGQALAAENRRIEAELTAEEKRLTELRPEIDPAEFRRRADAFDARVQELREQQDAKARAVTGASETARRQFLTAAQPVLAEILREAGAAVIIERRSVLVSLDATDITALAIERIDAFLGDGRGLDAPAPDAAAPEAEAPGTESQDPAGAEDTAPVAPQD
ncbi:OmpH family outer membrane protein [Roseivivax sp. CAU 1761]